MKPVALSFVHTATFRLKEETGDMESSEKFFPSRLLDGALRQQMSSGSETRCGDAHLRRPRQLSGSSATSDCKSFRLLPARGRFRTGALSDDSSTSLGSGRAIMTGGGSSWDGHAGNLRVVFVVEGVVALVDILGEGLEIVSTHVPQGSLRCLADKKEPPAVGLRARDRLGCFRR